MINGAGDEQLFQAGAGGVGTLDRGAAEAGDQAGSQNAPPCCPVALCCASYVRSDLSGLFVDGWNKPMVLGLQWQT